MERTINVQIKKSVMLGLFAFASLFLMQCNNETEKDGFSLLKDVSSGFTKVTGHIQNRDVYPNTKDIIINISHVSGQDRVTQVKSPIQDDGTFNFEIDLARPQDVTMLPYLDFLYLVPGDSLHIEMDFGNLQDIRLSGGKSAEINHDFFKYFDATGFRTTYFNYRGVGTDCEMNCSWAEIREKMDEERNIYRDRRQTFLQKTDVCDEVVFLTEAMIELDYYRAFVGIIMHRDLLYKEVMDKETMVNELNEVAVKYFNSDYYSNTHFKFIASAYIPAARLVTQPDTETDMIDWTQEVAKTDTIKDFMFTVQAGNALLRKDLETFETFSRQVNHDYLLDRLLQEYKIVRTNMINPENISSYILGNPKDFTDHISFDKKNLLTEIVAPNYGKVQIINMSTSWCAPCRHVLDQLVSLRDEFAGKEVCFSFICLSGDTEEAREIYRIRGIDDASVYFTTNEEFTFLANTFSPIVFPYGLLVNRKGVLVDYGTHVRPENMLREKINLLLKQDNLVK